MEYKLLSPDFKVSQDGSGSLRGYASTFANWDSVKERPVKGAFAPHLADFLKDGFIAIGHDWNALPIGTPTEAYEDDIGLVLATDFHSTPMAQAARTVTTERLERGKSVKLSIGYEVLQDEYVAEGRLLKEIKLYEVSLVTVPANPLASVTGAKGQPRDGMTLPDHSETVLAAVQELSERYADLRDLRAKAGRVLSAANVSRLVTLKESLAALIGELETLLAAAEPEKGLSMADLRAIQHANRLRRLAIAAHGATE